MARVIFAFILYGILFFIPAGDLGWIEGWTFLMVTFGYVIAVVTLSSLSLIFVTRATQNLNDGFRDVLILYSQVF